MNNVIHVNFRRRSAQPTPFTLALVRLRSLKFGTREHEAAFCAVVREATASRDNVVRLPGRAGR